MSTTTVTYRGSLRTEARHHESGGTLLTDVPTEIGGTNSAPSPSDLLAAALGGCLLVTMAMLAEKRGINLTGATALVRKETSTDSPKRIISLQSVLTIPGGAQLTAEQREILAKAEKYCLVHNSLHPDISAPVEIIWA
ncbi:MAG: OsmC family protein [Pirellulales bacterium]|nr:OsmC family protein [Pirellulales bacterium]